MKRFSPKGTILFLGVLLSALSPGQITTTSGTAGALTIASPGPVKIVAGRPFVAEELSTFAPAGANQSASRTQRFQLERDAQGRTRTEPLRSAVYEPALTEIVDPVAGFRYVLDSRNHVAYRSRLPLAPAQQGQPRQYQPKAGFTDNPLGRKFMQGIPVDGQAVSMSRAGQVSNAVAMTTEIWNAEDMHLIMKLVTDDPRVGKTTNEIVRIDRNEPAPERFAVPPDYKIIDESGPFTVAAR